jgi:hypothetical protein
MWFNHKEDCKVIFLETGQAYRPATYDEVSVRISLSETPPAIVCFTWHCFAIALLPKSTAVQYYVADFSF